MMEIVPMMEIVRLFITHGCYWCCYIEYEVVNESITFCSVPACNVNIQVSESEMCVPRQMMLIKEFVARNTMD